MTKEQKIQEAWGQDWEKVKDHVNADGWFPALKDGTIIIDVEVDDFYVNVIAGFCPFIRPKPISGIENNNNWIKIESEEDLPKEGTVNHVFWNNEIIIVEMLEGHSKEKAFKEWNDKGFTHFRPIEKPKPPIY